LSQDAQCREHRDHWDKEKSRSLLLRGRKRVKLGERRRQCEQCHAGHAAGAHHSLLRCTPQWCRASRAERDPRREVIREGTRVNPGQPRVK